ncbi:high affinity glucose transporter [Recurvomyces mirabilis]|uniref:High affinity glucose transporter n=1 Tax=Recurvomyces mirabilis TaxID=574656 RepID=A0AAE0WRF0_9PEZI|nr:high affinity glucose transporter [Recurvomyces mirabilis]KAK5154542.1 high affinity glucose transporter [Recurvomyces mirabilis]
MAAQPKYSAWRLLYFILPSAITGFAYGWEVGSMGGILAMPQFLSYFDTPSSFLQGLMTAALIAGEFFGSLVVGFTIADRFGRRATIIGSAIVYLIGQVLVVAAQNRGMFIAGRAVNGLGAGPLFQTVSYYTAEITPAHIRGRVTSTLNSGIAVGLLISYWIQYGALHIQGSGSWRMCFALQLVPGVAIALLLCKRPESPRWLVQHDKHEDALIVLANLHADGDVSNVVVRSEFEEIRVVVGLEKSTAAPSYITLLFGRDYRRRTALAMGLQCMQQASGANIVLYYAAKVFAQTGRNGPSAALLANGISSALLLLGTVLLTLLLDTYGRRRPIFLGPLCMGTCLVVVGSMLVSFGSPHFDEVTQAVQFSFKNVQAGNAAIAFMFLFQFFFGHLSSSIPWTYQSEVYPVLARARGTALAVAANYFTNFWLGLYIPQGLNTASWRIYFIFAAINFGCAVLGYLFFPETANRTLEELDLLFLHDRRILVCRDPDACRKGGMLETRLDEDPEMVALELSKRLGKEHELFNGKQLQSVEYVDKV